ncbi:hypothetical protein [Crocosphaera sp.]|uniref:hypothetical protein n=1 Tax=Crocosphaera sp. TaxID=2729996 RepID=UPI003F283E44
MPSIIIWTPESDHDSKAVLYLSEKIIQYYNSDIKVYESSKKAFNKAIKTDKNNGLLKAVNIYLKNHDLVIFLLDADGIQSQSQRRQQPNSLINRVESIVNQSDGKAILVLIEQELESWLLIDCLGICCFYTKNNNTRDKEDWIKFAKKYQKGKTELIIEAEAGGKGAKEYLENLSKAINKKINPNLKDRDLKQKKYTESESPDVMRYIEINSQTINRNDSLKQFAQHFQS